MKKLSHLLGFRHYPPPPPAPPPPSTDPAKMLGYTFPYQVLYERTTARLRESDRLLHAYLREVRTLNVALARANRRIKRQQEALSRYRREERARKETS